MVLDTNRTQTQYQLSLRGNGYGIIGYMDNYVLPFSNRFVFWQKTDSNVGSDHFKGAFSFYALYFERPYFTYETECLEMSD